MTETGQSLASFGLCLAARKAVVDKQMGADPNLPGPGQYINPLTLGRNKNGEVKSVESKTRSEPSACIGREAINDCGRPIEKQLGNASTNPGPKYQLDNITYGIQVQSKIRSAPRMKFSTGPRLATSGPGTKTRMAEPSPQTYDAAAIEKGQRMLSTGRNIPGVKFMTGPRTYNNAAERENKSRPAPGQYDSHGSCGRQIESKYRSSKISTIGGGRHNIGAKTRAQEPGPGHYIDPLKEGRNEKGEAKPVLSSQKSYPSATFGTAAQRPYAGEGGNKLEVRPGPKYQIQGSMGRMLDSRYRSQPIISFGAR
ncbi:unnamed protein product [Pelagomonas calceolata]|jgi:hypothetical protein|uniref:Uncharacterized protein n=1 Tax=Pelagomonas calceolata TaxID=35677 RepID=A0A8J2WGV6_9STRA|nr:unnamed protein product [Pelagomonas calceolata]